MQNSFWYILLCFLSLLLFGYTLWKKKDAKLIVLYCFMSGLSFTIEFIIMILFKSYVYYPKVLPDPYFDNVLGAIASNAVSLPMASVFVAAFKLPFRKYISIVASFMCIEWLFLYLKIYKHYWWSTAYTGIGFIFIFAFAKKWLSILHRCRSKFAGFITLLYSAFYINACLSFVICGLFNLYIYRLQWFENPVRSHFVFNTIYEFFQSSVFAFIVINGRKYPNTIIGTFLFIGLDIFLYNANILSFLVHWSIFIFVLITLKRILVFCILLFINKYLLQSNYNTNTK